MLNFKDTAMICFKCEGLLNVAFNFRSLCLKSDSIFREIYCEQEEINWSKNLLALQFNIQKKDEEIVQAITSTDVKCEILDPQFEVEKNDESEYEYIAYEVEDQFIDENETIEYFEEHVDEIEIEPPPRKTQKPRKVELRSFRCELCGKDDFPSKASYHTHMHRHKTKKIKKSYEKKCTKCDLIYYSHIRLEYHIAIAHPTTYFCDVN
jgi:hypothetical protein